MATAPALGADDAPVRDLGRQVADPAAHQVEDGTTGRKKFAVELSDGVDVGDQPGNGVKGFVGRLVGAAKSVGGEWRSHGPVRCQGVRSQFPSGSSHTQMTRVSNALPACSS